MVGTQDEVYKALADEHRRQIVVALRAGPRPAGELAALVRLAPNAVSFHLNRLRAARLVTLRRQGRYLRYQLEVPALEAWLGQVGSLLGPGGLARSATGPGRGHAPPPEHGRRRRPRRAQRRPAVQPPPSSAPAPLSADSFTEPLPTELL